MGPHPCRSIRTESLRAPPAPGTRRRRHLSPRAGHRMRRRCRRRSGHFVPPRPASGRDDGRHGPHLRRGLRAVGRAEGKSQEEAQLLAVEYKPKPVPRDVVRALPMLPAPLVAVAAVPAGTKTPPPPAEVVKPLTPELRRLNVTLSADFMAELGQ